MASLHTYYIHEDRCKRCGRCLEVCEREAIHIPQGIGVTTNYGSVFIDPARCDGCGKCRNVCKIRAISKKFRPHL